MPGRAGVRLWDLTTGVCIDELPCPDLNFSGRLLLSVDGSRVIVVSGSQIRAFDGSTFAELWARKSGIGPAGCSPDASLIVTGGLKGRVRVWDGKSGRCLKRLATPDLMGRIAFVRIDPEHFQVSARDEHGHECTWDLKTWRSAVSVQRKPLPPVGCATAPMSYGEDGGTSCVLASADGRIEVRFSTADAYARTCVDGQVLGQLYRGDYYAEGVRMVADGRVLWVDHESVIRGWDILSPACYTQPAAQPNEIQGPPLSHDRTSATFKLASTPPQSDVGGESEVEAELMEEERSSRQVLLASAVRDPAEDSGFPVITSDGNIGIELRTIHADPEALLDIDRAILHSIRLSDSATGQLSISVSPSGRYALVSLSAGPESSGWFWWDLRSGKRAVNSLPESSGVFAVTPDWKSIVAIVGGKITIRDVGTGASHLRVTPGQSPRVRRSRIGHFSRWSQRRAQDFGRTCPRILCMDDRAISAISSALSDQRYDFS